MSFKNIICRLIFFLFIGTFSASAQSFSLNGEWRFKVIPSDVKDMQQLESDTGRWDVMPVPGNWDVENSYSEYAGKACYERTFTLPGAFLGKRILLRFEAVYETAEVFLNGEKIGEHKGGYTPFELDITTRIKAQNKLTVLVDNTYKSGAWWAWGGISRSVTVLGVQSQRILYQHITALPDLETGKVQINVLYGIENLSNQTDYILSYDIQNNRKRKIYSGSKSVAVRPNDTTGVHLSFTLKSNLLSLWHFDAPVLYKLTSTLYSDSEHAVRSDNFGVRLFEAKSAQLYLNGEPVRLNGMNRVHDHRAYGNTEPGYLVRRDILTMKELGGNLARIMHAPSAPNLLDFCDSIGFLLISEIPVWGQRDPNAFAGSPPAKQWISEMIRRDYNHPSIIAWSVANELGDTISPRDKMVMTAEQAAYVRSMSNYIKTELDSIRLITSASFTAFRPTANDANEPVDALDMIGVNCYGIAPQQLRAVHEKWPDKPLFATEFGKGMIGLSLNSKLHKDIALFQDTISRHLPYVAGTSLWTYNDYRSNYTGSTPSQNRGWGVVNEWRQRKQAFTELQKIYAPINGLEINKEKEELKISVLPKQPGELPNYILRRYKLCITQLDTNGQGMNKQFITLPEIKPGDNPLHFSRKPSKNASRCVVQLISPHQIPVYESHIDFSLPAPPEIDRIETGTDGIRLFFAGKRTIDNYIAQYDSTEQSIYAGYVEIRKNQTDLPSQVWIKSKNSFGESEPVLVKIPQSDLPLPPMIWHVEALNKSMVVGYESLEGDLEYVLEYQDNCHENVLHIDKKQAGAYKIDNLSTGDYPIRIKRKTALGESEWSRYLHTRIE
ncbi:hypothetical protein FACS189413_12950 [Bacteroidia bacterium]|nr:hypothetical protein FACS189413_12950 [Bacteroidia bacterium]